MMDKLKDRIEKLLNLSLSDNEHEADIARRKAVELMNMHNISECEVRKENFIIEEFDIDKYRFAEWLSSLYSQMARISGCIFSYRHGRKKNFGIKARGTFAGKNRDVKNAIYLSEFLKREVEKASKQYEKEYKNEIGRKPSVVDIRSFRRGFVDSVYLKLEEENTRFFSSNSNKDLVRLDAKSRTEKSKDFLINSFDEEFKVGKSNSKTNTEYCYGAEEGKKINLSQAVTGQDEVKKIGINNES